MSDPFRRYLSPSYRNDYILPEDAWWANVLRVIGFLILAYVTFVPWVVAVWLALTGQLDDDDDTPRRSTTTTSETIQYEGDPCRAAPSWRYC